MKKKKLKRINKQLTKATVKLLRETANQQLALENIQSYASHATQSNIEKAIHDIRETAIAGLDQ